VVHAEASFASASATVVVNAAGGRARSGSSPVVTVAALVAAVEAMGFDAALSSPPDVVLKVEGMMCQVGGGS
jgi:hypothetical protein